MKAYESIVLAAFSGWLLLSVAGQFKRPALTAIRYRDVLHLIPNWRFFAPVPARRDYHLEYRLRNAQSQPTRWKRVELLSRRTHWCFFWYPEKRLRKSFNTSVRRLTRIRREYGYDSAARSLAYLHLLNFLQSNAQLKGEALQFRIITCQDFAPAPLRLVFTSNWHKQASTSQ